MAVKASATITVSFMIDVVATCRYYKLQSSSSSAPEKPTAYPPSSDWTETEPTYSEGSTNTLYVVDVTVFTNATFSYSEVSKSTSYEAAKSAYNKAVNAEKVATNFLEYDSTNGLQIGNKQGGSWSGYRTKVKSDGFYVCNDSGETISKFGANSIELANGSGYSSITVFGDEELGIFSGNSNSSGSGASPSSSNDSYSMIVGSKRHLDDEVTTDFTDRTSFGIIYDGVGPVELSKSRHVNNLIYSDSSYDYSEDWFYNYIKIDSSIENESSTRIGKGSSITLVSDDDSDAPISSIYLRTMDVGDDDDNYNQAHLELHSNTECGQIRLETGIPNYPTTDGNKTFIDASTYDDWGRITLHSGDSTSSAGEAQIDIGNYNSSTHQVTISPPLPVGSGGTGSSTASGARSNIGAYGVGDCPQFKAIELGYGATTGHGGYFDFHYNGSSADYTSRIIESSSGHLSVYAGNGIGISSRIARNGGGSWIASRNQVAVYGSSCGQGSGSSYNVCVGQATNSGVWTIGNLSGDERLCFAYTTNSDYSAGTNRTGATVYLPVSDGQIALTSDIAWTFINSVTGTSTCYFSGSSYNEIMVVCLVTRNSVRHSCSYSAPTKSTILGSEREIHLTGGSYTDGGKIHAWGRLCTSYFYGSNVFINDEQWISSTTWYIFAR